MVKVLRKDLYFEKTGYSPHNGQKQIHYTASRFRVISNGRRWGKTFMGAKELEPCAFSLSAVTGQPQTGWIVGPQYQDAEKEFRIVYDSFRKHGVDKHSIKFVNNPDNGSMHIKTTWGFELLCRSAGHPETLVGEGLDFVLMVEAGRHRRRTWGQYLRPALSDKRGWAIFSGVPEGRSENSLLYALWSRGQDDRFAQWRSWRMPSWTNHIVFPGGRKDPEILEAEGDLTEDEFARQYGAQFVEKTGAVMQEWDDEIHLKNLAYKPGWPVYGAVDYGFTNPFVWLWIQVDEWGNAYVIRERRWTQKDTVEIGKEMLENPIDAQLIRNMVAFYPDPAEPDDTLTLSRAFKKPNRGNTGGELKTRLSIIRQKLKAGPPHLEDGHPEKQPFLLVDRSCQSLAWEMREGYKWPEHRSEVTSEREHPLDKDNHGVEALGRFMRGYYGMPGQIKSRTTVSSAQMGGRR
jgi:hypothetical protein